MPEIKKIKKDEAKIWIEGDELIRLYYKTDDLMFGSSFMSPGTKGDIDNGHTGCEVFWVAKGYLMVYFPESDEYHEIEEGEALVIPPKIKHMFYNPSDKVSIIVWACHKPDL